MNKRFELNLKFPRDHCVYQCSQHQIEKQKKQTFRVLKNKQNFNAFKRNEVVKKCFL